MKAHMKEKGTSIVTSFSGHPTSRQSAPGNFMVTRLKVRYTFRVLLISSQATVWSRRSLFAFCKRSLPFLTVDAIIGNQAFCHGRCNLCSGLSTGSRGAKFEQNV